VRRSLKFVEAAFKRGYRVDLSIGSVLSLRGTKMRPTNMGCGYPVVEVSTPGITNFKKPGSSRVSVHNMVAYAKYGRAAFKIGLEIRHLDDCPTNNSGKNIKPGTRLQNILDIPKERRREIGKIRTRHLVGKPNVNRKLSDEAVRGIRGAKIRRGEVGRLAKKYKVSHVTISNIIWRKSYASVR